MKSFLIAVFATLLSPTLFHGQNGVRGAPASATILVLVANGSDITINLPGENNHNRLLSVVSNSGNNNPSVFDWIGGNGANKAPRLSIGGGNQGSNGATRGDDDGKAAGAADALIDALWKQESSTVSSSDDDEGRVLDSGDSLESTEEEQLTNSVEGTSTMKSSSSVSSVRAEHESTTGATVDDWRKKYVTVATAGKYLS